MRIDPTSTDSYALPELTFDRWVVTLVFECTARGPWGELKSESHVSFLIAKYARSVSFVIRSPISPQRKISSFNPASIANHRTLTIASHNICNTTKATWLVRDWIALTRKKTPGELREEFWRRQKNDKKSDTMNSRPTRKPACDESRRRQAPGLVEGSGFPRQSLSL